MDKNLIKYLSEKARVDHSFVLQYLRIRKSERAKRCDKALLEYHKEMAEKLENQLQTQN